MSREVNHEISKQCQPLQFFVLSPPTILTDGSGGIKTRLIIEMEERELICTIKIKSVPRTFFVILLKKTLRPR